MIMSLLFTVIFSLSGKKYKPNPAYIAAINKHQKSWHAVHYKEFQGMDLEDMIKMAGGRKSRIHK